MIATDHAPHSDYEKELEFLKAPFGVIGFESAFPLLFTEFVKTGILSLEVLIDKMTAQPAEIINRDIGTIKEGGSADVSIIDLDDSYIFDEREILSKSKNNPFIGREMTGRILYTICDGKFTWKKE